MDKMSRHHIHLPGNTGERLADLVVGGMGSWTFILIQSCIVFLWMLLNMAGWFYHWDPAPFILLNLVFSTQAAYASPLILMAANRQSAKDRFRDDIEAREVQSLYDNHQLLLQINQQQLEILHILHNRQENDNG